MAQHGAGVGSLVHIWCTSDHLEYCDSALEVARTSPEQQVSCDLGGVPLGQFLGCLFAEIGLTW